MGEADLVTWWIAATEWVSKVVATAAIVLGAIWKWLTHMITRKVKEEIELAMRVITDTTSKAIDSLRHELLTIDSKREERFEQLRNELHASDKRAEERSDRLADRLSDRIDNIVAKRGDR